MNLSKNKNKFNQNILIQKGIFTKFPTSNK